MAKIKDKDGATTASAESMDTDAVPPGDGPDIVTVVAIAAGVMCLFLALVAYMVFRVRRERQQQPKPQLSPPGAEMEELDRPQFIATSEAYGAVPSEFGGDPTPINNQYTAAPGAINNQYTAAPAAPNVSASNVYDDVHSRIHEPIEQPNSGIYDNVDDAL